jgi:transcriptional regulator with AAA-type ATPase domain
VQQAFQELFAAHTRFDIEYRIQRKDGEWIWLHDRANIVAEKNGQLQAYGVFSDVTEAKHQEEALRNSKEKLKDTLYELEKLKDQIEKENIYLQEEIKLEHNFGDIIGRSTTMKKMLNQVEQVATTGTTVLILGETGTGKELAARAIHGLSKRKERLICNLNYYGFYRTGNLNDWEVQIPSKLIHGSLQQRTGTLKSRCLKEISVKTFIIG